MKTPLVMSFVDNYRDIFLAADSKRKSQYGNEWINSKHKTMVEDIVSTAEDPNITADDLLQALRLERPPTRIKSETMAKFFFGPLTWLPDKLFYMVP